MAGVLVLGGCAANEGGHAFQAPDGYAYSGLPVTPGTTAVIGLGNLQLVNASRSAQVRSLHVEGDDVNNPAGHILGVKVYSLAPSGGIGAITAEQLSGVDGNQGWALKTPEGVHVPGDAPLGVAVLVRGESLGTWSSDSLVIDYTMDGRNETQHVPIGALVCVVANLAEGCSR